MAMWKPYHSVGTRLWVFMFRVGDTLCHSLGCRESLGTALWSQSQSHCVLQTELCYIVGQRWVCILNYFTIQLVARELCHDSSNLVGKQWCGKTLAPELRVSLDFTRKQGPFKDRSEVRPCGFTSRLLDRQLDQYRTSSSNSKSHYDPLVLSHGIKMYR